MAQLQINITDSPDGSVSTSWEILPSLPNEPDTFEAAPNTAAVKIGQNVLQFLEYFQIHHGLTQQVSDFMQAKIDEVVGRD